MAAVYSTLMFAAAGVSSPVTTVVPVGFVWVIVDIAVYSDPIVASFLYIEDGNTGGTFAYFDNSPLSSSGLRWTGRQVFGEGESFIVKPRDGPWDVRISGYALTLP